MLNIRRYQWWKNKIRPHARRIVLTAGIFILASTSLAFHAPLYNSDVSVEFGVVNKNGKSYYQYPKDDSSEIKKFKKKYTFLAGVVGHTNAGRISSFKQTDYSYSGVSNWIDDGKINNKACWRIKFTTSGTFIPSKKVVIDSFLVSGGGGGRNGIAKSDAGGGGAGGYTGIWANVTLAANQNYTITIGAGGAADGGTGGITSIAGPGITTMSKTGGVPNGSNFYYGGNGGSGGGGYSAGVGGSDGSNGGGTYGGAGQGTTTKEFGEPSGALYAGGGGCGGYGGTGIAGGSGGGGKGGDATYSYAQNEGVAGTANTGGGGGGGSAGSTTAKAGGAGGSGICVIRNTRS